MIAVTTIPRDLLTAEVNQLIVENANATLAGLPPDANKRLADLREQRLPKGSLPDKMDAALSKAFPQEYDDAEMAAYCVKLQGMLSQPLDRPIYEVDVPNALLTIPTPVLPALDLELAKLSDPLDEVHQRVKDQLAALATPTTTTTTTTQEG